MPRPILPLSQQQLIDVDVGYNGSIFVSSTQLPTASQGGMSHDRGAFSPETPFLLSKHSPKSTIPKDDPSHLNPSASQLQASSTIDALFDQDSFAFLGRQFDQSLPSDVELDLRCFETSCDKDFAVDGNSWDIILRLPSSTPI